jgi:hypothetical protein
VLAYPPTLPHPCACCAKELELVSITLQVLFTLCADAYWALLQVRQATAEVGGTRAVNCKSGKDRTALELALSFSQEACLQGYVPSRLQYSLKERLQVGLSYELTGENNGQPNAYAFSELELACLPAGWAPPWRYCGKVMS